jgi:uncharacterized DUF497 family protein
VEFGWDSGKNEPLKRERGFGLESAARIFAGPVIEVIDRRRDYGEERIRAIGEIDGQAYVVIYTDRGNLRWLITAWRASGKDLRAWRKRE